MSRARSMQHEVLRITQLFPVPKSGGPIDFAFRLPSQAPSALPPSFARLTDGLAIHIRYCIRAVLHPPVLSLRRKERIESEILYLPKSVIPVPPSPPSPLDCVDTSCWHSTPLHSPEGSTLLLPDTTHASRDPLPFVITLPTGSSPTELPRVELVRHVAARADDWQAHIVTIASVSAQDKRLPAVPGEVTWSVIGTVYVKYFVKVGDTSVPITLRTHAWDAEGAEVKGPAFELAPRP
ncbi:hypothetical protein EXIGLDRAFT_730467 [Exidia glandulosa HHB12029]|uniref:Uncharacterized protein n=1 Tax=Exidia glandulosa HHB12029 TaxID=1314781 RepID=A0A165L912_EXIGL|nr:hypothetical protein EXIGLDRAFT_730467 [Exidia glandulosa HHB12029]